MINGGLLSLKNALSVVITIGILYLLLGWMADLTASFLPDSWEAKAFSWYLIGETTEKQEPQKVNEIFDKLITHASLRKLPYTVQIIPGDKANAFAFPGGRVLITQTLLDSVESDIGIAMVLGHELGHHQYRHCLKRLGRGLFYSFVLSVMGNMGQKEILQKPLQLAELRYGRDQEIEADEFGLRLVYSVYQETSGATDFFEFVVRGEGKDRSRWLSFLRTHPYTPDRIERLKKLVSEMEK
ncbi:MAG: M48 family metallopeptidase [Planctomycetes bacterium]|nr:M48 family metallopeptidase [Planctomycetota bacterium]